jgi:protease I
MNKIAFIIAFKNFRDEEYFIPKEIFEKNNFAVDTISSEKGIAFGGDGGEAEVQYSFDDFEIADYSALVLAGGPGAYKLIENEKLLKIIQNAKKQGKLIAAICIAPTILARAGVLQGKKATVWSSPMDKSPIKILKDNGAEYVDRPVVEDRLVITANGPQAAEKFAITIINVLN